jgi:arginase family enzyme
VSRLRAKCPDCRTLTAVALGPEYQCHSCGREFAAGLIRVPRAWGNGGDGMAEAAGLPLPYPEAAVVEEDSLRDQILAVAADLPDRPLVLGGCCCSHIGAIEGLAARYDDLGIVWLDAHGDLNTHDTSPSGNEWGMPLRMAIDSGAVGAQRVALVGARNLDPPEEAFIAEEGVLLGPAGAQALLAETRTVYVALDADAIEPGQLTSWMPEPDGLSLGEVEALFARLRDEGEVVGAGISGLLPDERNVKPLTKLLSSLGF